MANQNITKTASQIQNEILQEEALNKAKNPIEFKAAWFPTSRFTMAEVGELEGKVDPTCYIHLMTRAKQADPRYLPNADSDCGKELTKRFGEGHCA